MMNTDIKIMGHYYKIFKGDWGTPTRITVLDIKGDKAMIIRGHFTQKDFDERGDTIDEAIKNMCLTKMQCNVKRIITELSEKQKQRLAIYDRELEEEVKKLRDSIEAYKNSLCI